MPIAHTHELDSLPNLTMLFGKAVLTGFNRHGTSLPSTVYSRDNIVVDPTHLSAYNKVCGYRLTDELPITYPHILSFPLQIKLMTDADFPFPLVGSVHLANRITQLSPIRSDAVLKLRVHVEDLRTHPKGQQFDMVAEGLVANTLVWRSVSTYLHRTGSTNSGPTENVISRQPAAIWRIPDDTGRRYADISGDRNPIHLHPLTAKLFGFRRAIAHGMWTKARCLAAFEGRLPEAYSVDVRFKTPVLLPSKAGFATTRTPTGWTFDLFNARTNKPHLTGTIS